MVRPPAFPVAVAALCLAAAGCSKAKTGHSTGSTGECVACHGGPDNSAPPIALSGALATSSLSVGAHQMHLHPGPFRKAVGCDECHPVPATVSAPGHNDGMVYVVFGGLATAGGATRCGTGRNPASPSCSATYCHGGTLAGGTNNNPVWTIGGRPSNPASQVACGTCHGIRPHRASRRRRQRHPRLQHLPPGTVKADGALDLQGGYIRRAGRGRGRLHGLPRRPGAAPAANASAPPRDLSGNTATTFAGVDAHQSHLTANTGISQTIACGECHVVPPSLAAHPDGQLDISWGLLSKAGGAGPSWDPGTLGCSATYCHGSTLQGGTLTAPVWNKVDGTQAACGTCHGIPPPPPHSQSPSCGTAGCHGYTNSTVDPAKHIDGYVNLGDFTCTSCPDAGPAGVHRLAPPPDVSGDVLPTSRASAPTSRTSRTTRCAGGGC
jgi:predicted CxxxxCH...CXXCH cytochrome family protein